MVSINDIVSNVRIRFEQQSSVRWIDSEIQNSARGGVDDLAEATGFYERYLTIRSLGTQQYFDLRGLLPESAVIITKVWSEGTNRWLKYVSPKSLDQIYSRWDSISPGGTSNWLMRGMNWLGIFPRLQAGGSVRIYYQGIPSFILDDRTLEDDYASAIEEYALYDMCIQDGDKDKALGYFKEYSDRETALTAQIDERVVRARMNSLSMR